MVKSFINAFCGGVGRTLGKILVYLAIGLIFFFIYDEAHAAAIYANNCTSTYYSIMKQDGTYTYGKTSTSYNIDWETISFDGTENLDSNTYYDVKIVFRSNFTINALNTGPEIYSSSSLCGSGNTQFQVTGFGVSGSTLTFRFLTGLSMVDYWHVWIPFYFSGSNGINSVTFSKVDLSGSSGIIENANENTNTIINNQNQNTQDVIDNQNDNTQDIIDNQNQNTQDIIDSQEQINDSLNTYCKNGPTDFDVVNYNFVNGYINEDGLITNDNQYKSSPYFVIKGGETYTIKLNLNRTLPYICWYYANKNKASCVSQNNQNTFTLTAPINAKYLRVTVGNSSGNFVLANITGPICNNWELEKQNELNGFLTDSSDGDTNIFNTWWDNFDPLSNPLGNLITLPITLAQKIVSFNNSSCQSINLGSLFGTNLVLPCFTLTSVLPDNATSLITLIDTIMCVSVLVFVFKATYETISNIISLGGENEVKMHFSVPTPLDFLCGVLGGTATENLRYTYYRRD